MALSMGNNGEIQIVLKVNDDGSVVVKKFGEEAEKSLGQAGEASDKLGLKAIALGTLIGQNMGDAIAAIAKFAAHMLVSGIEAADAASKTAEKLGMTVEEVTALDYAAKQSDLSMQDLSLALKNLAVNASQATDKSSSAHEAFRAIGVRATTASGQMRPMRELLLDVADKFANMKDGIEKTALAQDLFGRSGQALMPFLNQGAAGINKLAEEAQRLGVVIANDTAQQARLLKDNIAALQSTTQTISLQIATEFVPGLLRITDATREALIESGKFKAILVAIGGVIHETFVADPGPAAQIRSLKSGIADLTEELEKNRASLAKWPDSQILKKTDKFLQETIDRKKIELKDLQEQVNKEEEAARTKQKNADYDQQRIKDIKSAKDFIDGLKREAETFGLAKERLIAYDAAKLASTFGAKSKDIVANILAQADAFGRMITVNERLKAQRDIEAAGDAAIVSRQDNALAAIYAQIAAWGEASNTLRESNDERRAAQLLQELALSGYGKETAVYKNLEAQLNSVAGRKKYFDELNAKAPAREAAIRSIEEETRAIQLETVMLGLNNDQRERAQLLQKLAQQGLNVLSDPEAARALDEFDDAQKRRRLEREKKAIEDNKKELNQRVADLIISLASSEEAENLDFQRKQADLDSAHAHASLSDQAYQETREALARQHAANLQSIQSRADAQSLSATYAAEIAKFNAIRIYRQLTIGDALFMADTLATLTSSHSRKMFELGKAAALASGAVQATRSVISAYAAGSEIGGPIVGAVFAAIAAAAQAVNMQRLASLQFGGGASGAAITSGGASAPVFNTDTTGNVIAAPPAPQAAAPAGPRGERNVTLIGDTFSAEFVRDTLFPLFNDALRDGVVLNVKQLAA